MQFSRNIPLASMAVAATVALLSMPIQASVITVNTLMDVAADDGLCSLREAIISANDDISSGAAGGECIGGDSSSDSIAFDIPDCDGVCTIQPSPALPIITDRVLIDGLSQPGADCSAWPPTLLVELDGTFAGQDMDGLRVRAEETTIRGLVINRFDQDGIEIDADNSTVECNFVGTDADGTEGLGNGRDGVRVDASTGNTVGGIIGVQRNLISGNDDDGVDIRGGAFANRVEDNFIGTDVFGTSPIPNTDAGIRIGERSLQNVIGGLKGEGNLMSGNASVGLLITGGSVENVVQGNFIGTDVTGMLALANQDDGIQIVDSPGNIIGGARGTLDCAPPCNVISGNRQDGVVLVSADARDNVVRGNFIGVTRTGTTSLRNTENGVILFGGASNNTIGGINAGEGNLISGNGQDGIQIFSGQSTGNMIYGNLIGTDATGTTRLSNGNDGIEIYLGSSENVIGGAGSGSGNVISGNNGDGIKIRNLSRDNLIQGNCIGISAAGGLALGNFDDGVDIGGPEVGDAPDNLVGGIGVSNGNLIAFNAGAGVTLSSGTGNAVLRNSTFANGALGIDLGDDGFTGNDTGDGDVGVNQLQNTPTLVSASRNATNMLTINYQVTSAPGNAAYPLRVEFFAADGDQQEGAVFLGSDLYTSVEAQQQVTAMFVPAGAIGSGRPLVATATDVNGNTSEFSNTVILGGGVASDIIFADDFEIRISALECIR